MQEESTHTGFTYIELIIVLSIMALTLAFVGPHLERYNKTRLVKQTARKIYTNLQLARLTAIKENHDVKVTFDLSAGNASMMVQRSDGSNVIPQTDFFKDSSELTLRSTNNSNSGILTFKSIGTVVAKQAQTIIVEYNDPAIQTIYDVIINGGGGVRLEKG